MALKDIIKNNVVAVRSTATIQEAARLMSRHHVGSLVVVKKEDGAIKTPVGMLTDRDIVLSIGKNGKLDTNLKVKDVMTSNIILSAPGDGIYETIQKMRSNGVRRLPVVNKNDHLVGIVTCDDLMQLLGSELDELSQVQNLARLNEYHHSTSADSQRSQEKSRPQHPA